MEQPPFVWLFLFLGFLPRHGDLMENEVRYASVSRWLSPDSARLLDFGCARLVNAVKASLRPDKKMSFMCY